MDALSPASCSRQVAREGARWNLVPEIVADDVKVCEMRHEAHARGGLGEVTKAPFRLCTVDDESPFSTALNNRIDNGEVDLARRYQMHDDLVRKQQQAQADALDDEIRAMWKTRKRVLVGPDGLYVPAGLAERARRRTRA